MAFNIKDRETEKLVAEVATMTRESKTTAVGVALLERRDRLALQDARQGRLKRILQFLESEVACDTSRGAREAALQTSSRGDPGVWAGGGVIVDSSAFVAILLREPNFETLVGKIVSAKEVAVGAPTLSEAGLVLSGTISRGQISRSPESRSPYSARSATAGAT